MQNIIFWFRNDLRLHDNEAFLEASKAGNVVPVYVFDTRYFEKNFLGLKRTGLFRTKFLLEAVEDLRKNLRDKGSELIIRIGHAEEIIAQMAEELEASAVFASKEVTQDETTIEALLSKTLKPLNIDIDLIWSATLFHARDLPFQINFLPKVFTDFRKKIEQATKVRKTFDAPAQLPKVEGIDQGHIPTYQDLGFETEPVLDERSAFNFKGGETEGLKRLNEFIWQKGLLKTYKETRNGLIGEDYSSKISPWLSLGCISPRQVYEQVKKYESEVVANESTYWLIFELIWRDYFYFSALKHGTRMFKASGIKNDLMRQWSRNKSTFETWVKGETGVPFIDANMRELQLTGYLSNRGRQNVASYLAKDLGIDWTWGAAYFESALIDYDVCINWGNWNYIAGVGNDPQEGRKFDTQQQADFYDPEQEYIKLWLGENIHS
ncbi:DASH family cryptochrome [Emticicia sp. C21]|uniref:DASH family cryptochrome n=1 Tax=Emticicia sp. C21 TaxID=2302915 RepID=UPI000E3567E4|nr:DASH family cryptochrome [Emticicia sp. C21]RFS15929.1 DASH family cryptochrome [Emticicia sp. C21]